MSVKLSPAKKAWITRKIKSGRSKYKTSLELSINYQTVLRYAKDLPNNPKGRSGIRGNTLKILQELITNGYAFLPSNVDRLKFQTLRKYFPTILKTHYQGKRIIFLRDKADAAARAYLNQINKKIISYQELKTITKLFDTDLSRKEKNRFIGRKRSKRKQ